MSDEITLSELRELPASAIQALPRATVIVNGDTTIGILIPVNKPSAETMAAVFAEIDAEAARCTPEETRELEIALGERNPD